MTPKEILFWTRAQRRAAGLSPEIRAAMLRAFEIIRESLSERELAALIDSGNLDLLWSHVTTDVLDRAFAPVRQRIRSATERGFRYAVPSLPGGGLVDGIAAVSFDYLNPRVVTAIRQLETKVVTAMQRDVRETVRAFVENGLRDGVNPRVIGKQLRGVIGLGPSQLQQVENYRDALLGQNGRVVSDYTLRDQRLNPKTPEQIEKAVEAYRKRRVALNAEANARTAALDAMKLGQRLSYQDAIDKGIIDPNRLMHQWIGVMDDRERPEHVAMEKEIQPYNVPYSNGELVPGESTYNCRCLDRYFLASDR